MEQENQSGRANFVFYIGVLIVIIFLFFFLQDNPGFLENIVGKWGIMGLFISSIIANATILLPLPLDILVAIIGSNPSLIGFESFGFFQAIFLAVLIGFGSAIGEMTSYLIGLTGIKVAEKASKKEFEKLKSIRKKIKKSGVIFIFLGSLTPFPFDLVGIASGLVKYDIWKFFIAAFLGKFVRNFLILIASNLGITFITSLFVG